MSDTSERLASDINMIGAVQALGESSLFRSPLGRKFEQRLVALCNEHARRVYEAYDKESRRSVRDG